MENTIWRHIPAGLEMHDLRLVRFDYEKVKRSVYKAVIVLVLGELK